MLNAVKTIVMIGQLRDSIKSGERKDSSKLIDKDLNGSETVGWIVSAV